MECSNSLIGMVLGKFGCNVEIWIKLERDFGMMDPKMIINHLYVDGFNPTHKNGKSLRMLDPAWWTPSIVYGVQSATSILTLKLVI